MCSPLGSTPPTFLIQWTRARRSAPPAWRVGTPGNRDGRQEAWLSAKSLESLLSGHSSSLMPTQSEECHGAYRDGPSTSLPSPIRQTYVAPATDIVCPCIPPSPPGCAQFLAGLMQYQSALEPPVPGPGIHRPDWQRLLAVGTSFGWPDEHFAPFASFVGVMTSCAMPPELPLINEMKRIIITLVRISFLHA